MFACRRYETCACRLADKTAAPNSWRSRTVLCHGRLRCRPITIAANCSTYTQLGASSQSCVSLLAAPMRASHSRHTPDRTMVGSSGSTSSSVCKPRQHRSRMMNVRRFLELYLTCTQPFQAHHREPVRQCSWCASLTCGSLVELWENSNATPRSTADDGRAWPPRCHLASLSFCSSRVSWPQSEPKCGAKVGASKAVCVRVCADTEAQDI